MCFHFIGQDLPSQKLLNLKSVLESHFFQSVKDVSLNYVFNNITNNLIPLLIVQHACPSWIGPTLCVCICPDLIASFILPFLLNCIFVVFCFLFYIHFLWIFPLFSFNVEVISIFFKQNIQL